MKIIAIAQDQEVIDTIKEAEARGWQRANVVFVEMRLKDEEDRSGFSQLCRDAMGEVVVTAADGGIEDVRWLMRNDVADLLCVL